MESQTKHNNLLLEWDWEVFQDISTPTSLSFRDIPIPELPELDHHTYSSSLNQDMFEFSTATNPNKFSPSDGGTTDLDHYIIFCGQLIGTQKEEVTQKNGGDQQDKVKIITTNTKKRPSHKMEEHRRPIGVSRESSKSLARGKVFRRYTTLRNKDVLIGFGRNVEPARMEMRDIKERQKKMAAGDQKDEAVVVKGDRSLVVVDGRGGDGAGKGHWSLIRTLRFRAYLSTVLNKASLGLGCFSIPPVTNGA